MLRRIATVLALLIGNLSVPALAASDELTTNVFVLPTCPSSPTTTGNTKLLAAAVLSAVAKPLVDGFIGAGINAIHKAAADSDETLPSNEPVTRAFYAMGSGGDLSLHPAIRCVVVVVGRWGKAPQNLPAQIPEWLSVAIKQMPTKEGPASRGNQLMWPPALYLEANVVTLDSLDRFALKPHAGVGADSPQHTVR